MLDAQLDATKRFRRDDPFTSLHAAATAASVAQKHCDLILELLRVQPAPIGATAIAEKLGLTQVQVCRRLPELLRAGAIQVGAGEGRTPTGRLERLWEAVEP